MSRSTIPPDTRIGPFRIEALIGRGGMGDVYRAVHGDRRQKVALKTLLPELAAQDEFAARFVREARTMRALDHPAIVPVYDAGEADGRLYLAMQLIGSGISVKDRLAGRGIPFAAALPILRTAGEALDYAHGRGVIHRDIKPANILLDDHERPMLADFGLAKALDDISGTVSMQYVGSPVYMAPEQAAGGSVGHRADLYSFACTAFEMLTGAPPYAGKHSAQLTHAHTNLPVPRISEQAPELPGALDRVFQKALAKTPVERYPSAEAFLDAVDAARIGGSARRSWGGRRAVLAGVGALAVAAALVAVNTYERRVTVVEAAAPVTSAQAAPVTAAPTTTAAAAGLPVAVGQAFFAARFDAPDGSFYDAVGRPTDPAAQAVRYSEKSLELAALAPNGDAGTELRTGIHTGYVANMVFTVTPGSRVIFDLGLRWAVPGKLAYLLRTDTAKNVVYLAILKNGEITPLASAVAVPDLTGGRPTTMTAKVDGSALTLWVNGDQVSSVTDTQVVETAGTVPGLDVYGDPGAGTVRVSELTFYNLPT